MLRWSSLTLGSLHWHVNPGWHERLLNSHGLRLDEWREQQLLHVVKQAPHRTVYRITLPDSSVYIKHYPVADVRAYVRQRMRPSKARTELERAHALAERHIPSVEPLGLAEHPSGESYLVTRGLDGAGRLDDFIQQAIATKHERPPGEWHRLRIEIAERLAKFLAKLHEAGVLHCDLHAGNLLIKPHTLELFLIDLHDVRLVKPLDWTQSRDNLVMLNRWLSRRTSRADRRRFWNAYAMARGWRSIEEPVLQARCRELERATQESCVRLWRARRKRCIRSSPHFYQLNTRDAVAWAVREVPETTFRALLADPDEPFKRGRLLKAGRSSTVVAAALPGVGQVVIKRFNVVDWSDRWRGYFRASPALRSWLNGHQLIDSGLPTPRPLMFIQRHRLGLHREAYLVWPEMKGQVDLLALALSWGTTQVSEAMQQKRLLAERLGWLMRLLHDRQLSHRDLKGENILVEPQFDGLSQLDPGDPRVELRLLHHPHLSFIDLVGLETWRRLPDSVKVRNLARLNVSFITNAQVSRTDRLRCLRAYMGWGVWGKSEWKQWWREIARATQRKLRKASLPR